jgi:pyruvate kinase
VAVTDGQALRLSPGNHKSTAEAVEVDYGGLLTDLHVGDRLTFGDGSVVTEVVDHGGDALITRICHGGELQGRPGLHIPSDRLRVNTPTDDDLKMIDAFVEAGIDMVALSFVRSAHDVRRVGTEPFPRGPLVVAKIETRAAVDNLAGIVEEAGAIMVARGDLGAECPIEELPHLQKRIIRDCIAYGRPVITATQMLESMVHAPTPTRAEASDVANAVFDGSSAVMLSGETAIGDDPINVVTTMARITERADEEFDYHGWARDLAELRHQNAPEGDAAITDAMTMATWRAAAELKVAAILCLSETGFTVRSIARFRPEAKILGYSTDPRTVQQLTMSWGTIPMHLVESSAGEPMAVEAIRLAKDASHVRAGDMVAVLSGFNLHSKATDMLRLIRVQ